MAWRYKQGKNFSAWNTSRTATPHRRLSGQGTSRNMQVQMLISY
nr:MAG TPA: hypothetical protein [Caudoviricetes sp.]